VPAQARIEWSSAEVRASTPGGRLELRVSVDGNLDATWSNAFPVCEDQVKASPANWGKPQLANQIIVVKDILYDTDTEALRTHLDAIVERANTMADEVRSQAAVGAAQRQARIEESERLAREMTDAFRKGKEE
jgi:hypothetical protein